MDRQQRLLDEILDVGRLREAPAQIAPDQGGATRQKGAVCGRIPA
jgi:hypothetical protein